jgi:hypothetical protein
MRTEWYTGGGGFHDSVCEVFERLLQNVEETKVVEHTK